MSETLTSRALVETDRPARYGKQLASHFNHKTPFEWNEDSQTGHGTFCGGDCSVLMAATPAGLDLTIDCAPDEVERFEGVVGRHLVRFGAKDELVCHWTRSDGEDGTTQRHDGE